MMLGLINFRKRSGADYEQPNKGSPQDGSKNERARKRYLNDRHPYPHSCPPSRGDIAYLETQTDIARVDRQVDRTLGGRVIWEAVSYPAYCECDRTFPCGSFVRVIQRRGNTLVIAPLPSTFS